MVYNCKKERPKKRPKKRPKRGPKKPKRPQKISPYLLSLASISS
jgi:hypothetical protein